MSDPGASVQSDALTTAYDEELRDTRQSEELAKARVWVLGRGDRGTHEQREITASGRLSRGVRPLWLEFQKLGLANS